MSDAYERERQNNSRLSELSAKVTALRGVTVDIYDNARSQEVIDNTVCVVFAESPSLVVLSALSAPFLLDFRRGGTDWDGDEWHWEILRNLWFRC
jgi:blocked-early-in-transport protein 1